MSQEWVAALPMTWEEGRQEDEDEENKEEEEGEEEERGEGQEGREGRPDNLTLGAEGG